MKKKAVQKGKGFQEQCKALEAELEALRAQSGEGAEATARLESFQAEISELKRTNAELNEQRGALEVALESARADGAASASNGGEELEALRTANAGLEEQLAASEGLRQHVIELEAAIAELQPRLEEAAARAAADEGAASGRARGELEGALESAPPRSTSSASRPRRPSPRKEHRRDARGARC